MPRHRGFTRSKFLKAVSADPLRSYFRSKRLAPPKLDVDAVNDFLDKLDADGRADIEEEFQCINDIADRGMDCLERAFAASRLSLNDKWPRERAAMELFLRSPEGFQIAYDLYLWRAVANTMSHHQLPTREVAFDVTTLEALRAEFEAHFSKQAKGKKCNMRHYKDGTAHVILVGRGDYMHTQQTIDDDGKVRVRFFRPAKEDVILFAPEARVLSIKTSGRGTSDRDQYLRTFCSVVLGLDDASSAATATVTLEPIRKGTFRYAGNESVQWVKLVEIHARLPASSPTRVRLNSPDVRRSLNADLPGVRLADCELASAKLKFKLNEEHFSGRPLTVEVRPPEHTGLNKRREAGVVEDYLRENGVLLV